MIDIEKTFAELREIWPDRHSSRSSPRLDELLNDVMESIATDLRRCADALEAK